MEYESYEIDERAALDAALSRLGLVLDNDKKALLLEYLHLLERANERVNLTRIVSLREGVVLHLEDSLSVYPEFSECGGDFCDLGTGGGVPGIPLAIATSKHGILLDSVKKKAREVQSFIEALGLQDALEACGERSEELGVEAPESFGVVVARAVSSFAAVEELATPLLCYGGHLIAMRGTETPEELDKAQRAADMLGLALVDTRKFYIGEYGEYQRSVYVLERVRKPQIKIPRRVGVAQKRPLG